MANGTIKIMGRLEAAAGDKILTTAGEILETGKGDFQNKTQSEINYTLLEKVNNKSAYQDALGYREEVTYAVTTTNQRPLDKEFKKEWPSDLQTGDWVWTRKIKYYHDNTASDPEYSVVRIAADGGSSAGLHLAYAEEVMFNASNEPDGITNFLTEWFKEAQWIGMYSGEPGGDSMDYKEYHWSRLTGWGITDLMEYYLLTTDKTPAPTRDLPEWQQYLDEDIPEPTAEKPYLWNYECHHVGPKDSNIDFYTEPYIMAVYSSGLVAVYEEYILSKHNDVAEVKKKADRRSTDKDTTYSQYWDKEYHAPNKDYPYLFNRTHTVYIDRIEHSEPHIAATFREDPLLVVSVETTYVVTSENVRPADSAFTLKNYPDTVVAGNYIWSHTVTTYNNGSKKHTYSVDYVAENGTSIHIKGTKDSYAELLALTGMEVGDGYIVPDEKGEKHLYVWDGTLWTDCGVFKGEKGDPAEYYYLKPVVEQATVYANEDFIIDVEYYPIHHIGDTDYPVTNRDIDDMRFSIEVSSDTGQYGVTNITLSDLNSWVGHYYMDDSGFFTDDDRDNVIIARLLKDDEVIYTRQFPILFSKLDSYEVFNKVEKITRFITGEEEDLTTYLTKHKNLESEFKQTAINIKLEVKNSTVWVESTGKDGKILAQEKTKALMNLLDDSIKTEVKKLIQDNTTNTESDKYSEFEATAEKLSLSVNSDIKSHNNLLRDSALRHGVRFEENGVLIRQGSGSAVQLDTTNLVDGHNTVNINLESEPSTGAHGIVWVVEKLNPEHLYVFGVKAKDLKTSGEKSKISLAAYHLNEKSEKISENNPSDVWKEFNNLETTKFTEHLIVIRPGVEHTYVSLQMLCRPGGHVLMGEPVLYEVVDLALASSLEKLPLVWSPNTRDDELDFRRTGIDIVLGLITAQADTFRYVGLDGNEFARIGIDDEKYPYLAFYDPNTNEIGCVLDYRGIRMMDVLPSGFYLPDEYYNGAISNNTLNVRSLVEGLIEADSRQYYRYHAGKKTDVNGNVIYLDDELAKCDGKTYDSDGLDGPHELPTGLFIPDGYYYKKYNRLENLFVYKAESGDITLYDIYKIKINYSDNPNQMILIKSVTITNRAGKQFTDQVTFS